MGSLAVSTGCALAVSEPNRNETGLTARLDPSTRLPYSGEEARPTVSGNSTDFQGPTVSRWESQNGRHRTDEVCLSQRDREVLVRRLYVAWSLGSLVVQSVYAMLAAVFTNSTNDQPELSLRYKIRLQLRRRTESFIEFLPSLYGYGRLARLI